MSWKLVATPVEIWVWWTVDTLILSPIGCAAMGCVGQRVTAQSASPRRSPPGEDGVSPASASRSKG